MSNANWFAQRQRKEWAADQYAVQRNYLATIAEPSVNPGDTQPLSLPPAPLLLPEYDLTSADWPEVEPLDSADADAADGYTDSYDDEQELP